MAFEDLFGDGGFQGGTTGKFGPGSNEEEEFDFGALFEDPNFVRGLGETGASISSGEPIGTAVGNFASDITKRRQLQKGARSAKRDNRSFQERLLGMLAEGQLLTPKDQNDGLDTFTMDGDGNFNFGMKNTPQKASFQQQQPLEAIRRPSAGGDDLRDFSNQPGGEAFDFAGLDSGDIALLLKAEEQFGQLSVDETKTILAEKARRSAVVESGRRRKEELQQLAKDRTATITAKALETTEKKKAAALKAEESARRFGVTSKLDAAELALNELKRVDTVTMTPRELEKHNLELANLQSQIDTRAASISDSDKPTIAQQNTIDKNNADIVRKETELGLKLDDLEKDEFFSMQPSFVDNKGIEQDVPFEEREANASQANNRPNNKVFYRVQQPIVTEFFDGKADQDGNVTPVFLPKHPTTGKQITSTDVIDTAKANNISPEEVLRQWGLVK